MAAELRRTYSDGGGAALELNRVLDAPPLMARTELDYAACLLARGRPLDRQRAAALLTATSRRAHLCLWDRSYHHCRLRDAAAVRTMRSRIEASPLLERFDGEIAAAGRKRARSG